MKIVVHNGIMEVIDASSDAVDHVTSTLTYIDKAKQYQLKRMARNPWQRNSPLYKKLQNEVEGKLYTQDASGKLVFSSCYYKMFMDQFRHLQPVVVDSRKETGKTVPLPWTEKPFDLRPYQEEAVELMLSNWRGVINFATGLGKTLVATHAVKRYRKRALIVCPSESVASQFYDLFVDAFGKQKVGFYGDGKKQMNDITVGIAASICKNIKDFKNHELGLVIVDEVHHVPANTFYAIAEGLGNVGKVFEIGRAHV